MKVWIVFAGETLPMDYATRQWRYGILAEALAERGHSVTRWAPTFNHSHKKQRYETDYTYKVNKNYKIELLYNRGYKHNIGFMRLLSYIQLAYSFQWRIKKEKPPEVIISGMPTPELCSISIRYGQQNNIPVIVDVRDLWPDIFLNLVPPAWRLIGKIALIPMRGRNRKIFTEADGIIGISETYLAWALKYAGRPIADIDKTFPLGYEKIELSKDQLQFEISRLINKGLDPHKTICSFLGSFGATYDLETVIQAAKLIAERGESHIQFILCGTGEKLNALKQKAKGLENVLFPGWISQSTIGGLLHLSSVGLVPYVQNAPQRLPNKPFEYFSGGLAVVSSLQGELGVLLKDYRCGITYGAGNANELANGIIELCTNSELLSEMRRNAYALYRDRYTVDHIYPEMVRYIEYMSGTNRK